MFPKLLFNVNFLLPTHAMLINAIALVQVSRVAQMKAEFLTASTKI